MFRILKFTSLLTLIFFTTTPAQALQPQHGWLLNVYFLEGRLDLKYPYSFDTPHYEDDYRLVQVGTGFGYAFGNGFTTELKFNSSALDVVKDLFGLDNYRLSEIHLATGYDFYFADRFSLGPEVRLTKVILKAEEGEFLNAGPEEAYSLDEYALTWGARAKWRATDRFTMALSYFQANYDFGDTHATGLELQWHWN